MTRCVDSSASTSALIERLVADLRPVHRLWPAGLRLMLWVLLELVIIFARLSWAPGVGLPIRADLLNQIHHPFYLFQLGAFALAGSLCAFLAVCSAVPGCEPRRVQLAIVGVISALAILSVGLLPIDTSTEVLVFMKDGLKCFGLTTLLALLPWLGVFCAVRRGMPMERSLSGVLVASAAFLFAFAITRIGCPFDDGLHLLLWHLLLPLGLAMLVSVYATRNWLPRLQAKVAAPPRSGAPLPRR
jgi:hypothetical protein